MDVAENIRKVKLELPEHVKLVAVSKTKPAEYILKAYESGHKIFGENKAQELSRKYESLPKDIEWHFIGHLQTNKIKYIAPFVSMIHGIDSFKLLESVNHEAKKCERVIPCLLQFFIAQENTKFGFSIEEASEMLHSREFSEMKNITVCGVMGMATFTEDKLLIRKEFRNLKSFFNKLKEKYFKESEFFNEISMGMSDDFEIGIEEGSTMVRIGSKIFGERNY